MKDAQNSPDPEQGKPVRPLFRSQAIDHQTRRLDGEVLLRLSLQTRVLIILGALVILGTGLFLATASYARMETVSGWIVPEQGLIRVTARQGGIVEELQVSEGNHVTTGAAMATLRLSSDIGEGNAGVALARHLDAQIEASRAEAIARREMLVSEERQLRAQRDALVREGDESRNRLATMGERMSLIQDNAERVESIAQRGFASTKMVEDAQINSLVAQQDTAEMRMMVSSLDRQISEIDGRLQSLPLDIRAADAQADANAARLAQRKTELSVQNRYQAAATVAGRVVAVPVVVGQSIEAGAVIAVLTPENSRLLAELYVPSRAAGFIRPGNETRLMYQAFPYQKFGTARGTVIEVSSTVLAPTEVALQGVSFNEPVFRVRVELESEVVDAYGQTMPLQPGMMLSANIVLDRRTLMEWLFDPIYAVGRMG